MDWLTACEAIQMHLTTTDAIPFLLERNFKKYSTFFSAFKDNHFKTIYIIIVSFYTALL